MKLKILGLACLGSILLVGCSQQKVEKSESLQEAYFQIGEKVVAKKDIDDKYIKNLLSGYNYEKGEEFKLENGNIDGSDYIQQPYIFTNENESLTITHSNYNNEEQIEPLYNIKDENGESNLSILMSNMEDDNYNYSYMYTVTRDNIKEHKELINLIDQKLGEWHDIYLNLIDNVCSTNDIDIKSIKELVGVEPTIEEYPFDIDPSLNLTMTGYIFETDDEMLIIQYIKEYNKIWSVFYNDKNSNTINNLTQKTLINKEDKLHTGIIAYVNNFEMQKKLLEYIEK